MRDCTARVSAELSATLLTCPPKFRAAVELAVFGHHFRTVAERL